MSEGRPADGASAGPSTADVALGPTDVGHDPLIGAVLDGRYRVLRSLGQGGMGQVYEALQLKLDRLVAVKVLHADLSRQPELQVRFEREARALARISHENVLHAYDHGVAQDGRLYFVTELVDGYPLDTFIGAADQAPPPETGPRRGLSLAERLSVLRQVASALGAVHGRLVHRDVKPSNVMVTLPADGPLRAKLLDFGLVKPVEGSNLTSKIVMGTPAYMSPEQISQAPDLDARSDLYSFGAMAFEVLTGRTPFDSGKVMDVLTGHMAEPPPQIDQVRPDIDFPSELVTLVDQLLEKRPEARPQSAEEVKDILTRIEIQLNESGVNAPSTFQVPALPPLDPKRRMAFMGVGAFAAVAAMTAGAAISVRWADSDAAPTSVLPAPLRTVAPPPVDVPETPVDQRAPPRPTDETAARPAKTTPPAAAVARPEPASPPPPPARRPSNRAVQPPAPVGAVEVTGFTITGRPAQIEVRHEGRVMGRGRRVRIDLPAGTHTLVVKRRGHAAERRRTVTITAGKTSQAKVLLD